tara:strand:+ start:787 stop:1473 length:687 start_codon:yes stop_codon:yes gene_type:complete
MKKILLSILFFTISYTNVYTHVDHYADIKSLEYQLYRNDKLIGFHNFIFERNNEELTVKSVVKFKITKLGVDLYKYSATSSEKYKKGVFTSYSSTTNQNKKKKYVNINRDEEKNELIIDGSSYKGKSSADFLVGTWWNHQLIKAKAQISGISGRIIKQKVVFKGKTNLNIDEKFFTALHFNFSSSDEDLPPEKKLNTDIWYDEKTNVWLKASFTKMGEWEYRIKKINY